MRNGPHEPGSSAASREAQRGSTHCTRRMPDRANIAEPSALCPSTDGSASGSMTPANAASRDLAPGSERARSSSAIAIVSGTELTSMAMRWSAPVRVASSRRSSRTAYCIPSGPSAMRTDRSHDGEPAQSDQEGGLRISPHSPSATDSRRRSNGNQGRIGPLDRRIVRSQLFPSCLDLSELPAVAHSSAGFLAAWRSRLPGRQRPSRPRSRTTGLARSGWESR